MSQFAKLLLRLIAAPVAAVIDAEIDQVSGDTLEHWKAQAKRAIHRALGV